MTKKPNQAWQTECWHILDEIPGETLQEKLLNIKAVRELIKDIPGATWQDRIMYLRLSAGLSARAIDKESKGVW